jgi:hypothetical protein
VEGERERALEDAGRAGEVARVPVGAEEVQGIGADLRLDPLRPQPVEDAVAVVDLDHVGLPAVDVAVVRAREQHGQVAQALRVSVGDRGARREQLVEAAQLRQPDGAEDVREAVVEAGARHVGRDERAPAVVPQLADAAGEGVVVRRDRAALARRDDLARVEAETAGDAEPAARPPAATRAERACRVLEQRQLGRQLLDAERPPEEVHAEQQLRARPDLELRRVDVHRLGVDVDEDGPEAAERHDVRGRGERVRGDEHLVAGLEPECRHRQVERGRARRDGERVAHLARARDPRLELAHLRPHREHAALEDLGDLGELGVAEVRPA